jgi:hypothetical protein
MGYDRTKDLPPKLRCILGKRCGRFLRARSFARKPPDFRYGAIEGAKIVTIRGPRQMMRNNALSGWNSNISMEIVANVRHPVQGYVFGLRYNREQGAVTFG